MRREGPIARIGPSNVDEAQLRAALDEASVAAVQNRYAPSDDADEPAEAVLAPTAAHGIAFVPHGPLGANPMEPGAAADPALALATLLARAPNVLPIPGTTKAAHLEANMAAAT